MKRCVMLSTCMFFIFAFSDRAKSQTIEFRAGQTLFPGMYAAFRYAHFTNSEINLAGGVFLESANKNSLRYRCYGAEVLAQYSSDHDNENLFSYKTSLGVCGQVEHEPWVYKDLSMLQRINYGVFAEGAGVINLSDVFYLSAFIQQRFLFKKILGSTHFLFGVSLSFRISQ